MPFSLSELEPNFGQIWYYVVYKSQFYDFCAREQFSIVPEILKQYGHYEGKP